MRLPLRARLGLVVSLFLVMPVILHAGTSVPVLFVDPTEGLPGTVVEVVGEGFFESTCGVRVSLDSTKGPLLGLALVDAGSFSIAVSIPGETTAGEHAIVAEGLLEGGEFCGGPSGESAEARFDVLGTDDDRLDFAIRLKYRTVEPDCGIDTELLQAIQAASVPTHAIVQLRSLPSMINEKVRSVSTKNDVSDLEQLGITLLQYLNGTDGLGTAYLASVRPEVQADDPRFDELVRCLVAFGPDDKVDRALSVDPPSDAPQPVLVLFFGDVSEEAIRTLFGELGLDGQPFAGALWMGTATSEQLVALAQADIVSWIQPRSIEERFDLDDVRAASQVDEVQDLDVPGGVYNGLSGDGVQIAIMDSGVDTSHNDFAGRMIRSFDDTARHGSHVAGIAAGSGAQSDQTDDASAANGGTRFQWRGMSPEAEIAAYSSSGASAGGNSATMGDAINSFGVDVSNHSYSSAPSGQYDALMAAIDSIIRGDAAGVPARPQVWSAGNGGFTAQYGMNLGYFALTKSCKNCVITANVGNNLIHAGGSSMGPTADGRMKPDVSAIGSNVTSVRADTDQNGNPITGNGYRTTGGTSMASPAVAGIVGLLLQQYVETTALDLDVTPPLPSTSRALLAHAAEDLAGTDMTTNPDTGGQVTYGDGPDWATGYGLVNARAAARIIADGGYLENSVSLFDVIDEFAVAVGAGQTELRVTLAWDDIAGSPVADEGAAKLVNDLDLTLIEPGGATIHRPLVMPLLTPRDCDGGTAGIQVGTCAGVDNAGQNYFGPAAEGTDRRNNTEQVAIEELSGLPTGIWTARVSVLNADGLTVRLPLGGSQSYSLVLQQPNRAPLAVCPVEPVEREADGGCCVQVTVEEIDAGSYDPNGDADIADRCITSVDGLDVGCQPSVEICDTGIHTLTLTITDLEGEQDSCDTDVLIVDVTPPQIACPDDAVLECPADTSPGSTGTASATDNCSVPLVGFGDVSEPGCGGTETITRTWTATDEAGNPSSCVQTVEELDTIPPDLTCGIDRDILWPPNHKLKDVGFSFVAEDGCDPEAPVTAISVTSDEHPADALGAGGPVHCPDALIGDDPLVQLRAERSGTGDGRVYRVTVSATDACDNTSFCSSDVWVPHDKGQGSTAVDSGQAFDASVCDAAKSGAASD